MKFYVCPATNNSITVHLGKGDVLRLVPQLDAIQNGDVTLNHFRRELKNFLEAPAMEAPVAPPVWMDEAPDEPDWNEILEDGNHDPFGAGGELEEAI